ncbi:hypothetical protein [Vibrio phage vB_VmeM-Yong XC32]|nr:hypothetical protein [Vibrio phage vB_VmeM-Yong XC31]QAX96479.1 hypothetical protein [Vibrio phage vB_VmeM-Yong XC32]QAX96796.1 hypothetical protein [Vibrio phage vB_VmeM-Yong MS31]
MNPEAKQVGHLESDVKGRSFDRYKIKGSLSLNPPLGGVQPPFLAYTQKDGNRQIGTVSLWIRRRGVANKSPSTTDETIFSHQASSTTASYGGMGFDSSGHLAHFMSDGTATQYGMITKERFVDCSRFYHIVVHWNTWISDANQRMRMFVDGKEIKSFIHFTMPPLGYQGKVHNAAYPFTIGHVPGLSAYNYFALNAEIADFALVDGQALFPKDFGHFDTQDNWRPSFPSFEGWGPNSLFLTWDKQANGMTSHVINRPSQYAPDETDDKKPISTVPTPGIKADITIHKSYNHTSNQHMFLQDSVRGDGWFTTFSEATINSRYHGRPAPAPNGEDEHLRFSGSFNWEKRTDNEPTYWTHFLFATGPEHGISIVPHDGTAAEKRIEHGLGRKPDLAINVVQESGASYPMYTWAKGFTDTNDDSRLNLHNGSGVFTAPGADHWRNSLTDETYFGFGSGSANNSASGRNFITYFFASVPGKSQYFKWEHRGSNTRTRFECGFRPRFFFWKTATPSGETADVGAWVVVDCRDGTAWEFDRTRGGYYSYSATYFNPAEVDDTGFSMGHDLASIDGIIMAFADESDLNRCAKSIMNDNRVRPINFHGTADISDATPDNPGVILSWNNANRWASANGAAHQSQRATEGGYRLELSHTRTNTAVGLGLSRSLPESGKWYFEVDSCYTFVLCGYQFMDGAQNGYDYYDYVKDTPGYVYAGGVKNTRRSHYIALDMDARTLHVTTSDGKVFTLPVPDADERTTGDYQFFVSSNVASKDTASINLGQRPFVNEMPVGYRPLNDLGNYQENSIEPEKYFDNFIYNGLQACHQDMSSTWAYWGVKSFEIDGELYLARRRTHRIANPPVAADWVNQGHVEIWLWNRHTKKFNEHHTLAMPSGGYAIDVKSIDGETYLSAGSHYNGSHDITGGAYLFRWNRTHKRFETLVRRNEGTGHIGTEIFDIDEDHLGWIMSSHRNGTVFDLDSHFFKVEKQTGNVVKVQAIHTAGAHGVSTEVFEGETWVTISEYRTGANGAQLGNIPQRSWRYDPTTSELVAAPGLTTGQYAAVVQNKLFAHSGNLYCLVSSRHTANVWTEYTSLGMFKLNAAKDGWDQITSMGSIGASEVSVLKKDDGVYISVPCYYNGTSVASRQNYVAFSTIAFFNPQTETLISHETWRGVAQTGADFFEDDGDFYLATTSTLDDSYSATWMGVQKFADKNLSGFITRAQFGSDSVYDSVRIDDADGEYVLMVEHVKESSRSQRLSDIQIHEYNPTTKSISRIGTRSSHGCHALDAKKIGGKWYLASVNHSNASTDTTGGAINIYVWNETTKDLDFVISSPVHGCIEAKWFESDGKTYVSITSNRSGSNYGQPLGTFLFDPASVGSELTVKPTLSGSGHFGLDLYEFKGETFGFIGGSAASSSGGYHTAFIKWYPDSETWGVHQNQIAGSNIPHGYGRFFEANGRLYLLLGADRIGGTPNATTVCQLYRYSEATQRMYFVNEVHAPGARNFNVVEYEGDIYAAMATWGTPESNNRGLDPYDWTDNLLLKFDAADETFYLEAVYPAHHSVCHKLHLMNDGNLFIAAHSHTTNNTFSAPNLWLQVKKGAAAMQHNTLTVPTDFVWLKSLSGPANSHKQFAKKVGWERQLTSDTADAASFTNGQHIFGVYKHGVRLAYSSSANVARLAYSVYAWKAAPEAGFDCTVHEGSGGTQHALPYDMGDKQATLGIIKSIDVSGNWMVQGPILKSVNNRVLYLNGTGAAQDNSSDGYMSMFYNVGHYVLGNQDVSNDHVNRNGQKYMGLWFRSIEGQVKVGRYSGTGQVDGDFVPLSFSARWIMIKSEASSNNWAVYDLNNGANVRNDVTHIIYPNLSQSMGEPVTDKIEVSAGGFRPIGAGNIHNQNGQPYVFIAIADDPFGTSNAY